MIHHLLPRRLLRRRNPESPNSINTNFFFLVYGTLLQRLQIPVVFKPRQKKLVFSNAATRRQQEEADELTQHVKDIDRLIVEGTMRKLIEEKDGIDKVRRQTNGRISQKQRKQLEKERVKNAADQVTVDKLLDEELSERKTPKF